MKPSSCWVDIKTSSFTSSNSIIQWSHHKSAIMQTAHGLRVPLPITVVGEMRIFAVLQIIGIAVSDSVSLELLKFGVVKGNSGFGGGFCFE